MQVHVGGPEPQSFTVVFDTGLDGSAVSSSSTSWHRPNQRVAYTYTYMFIYEIDIDIDRKEQQVLPQIGSTTCFQQFPAHSCYRNRLLRKSWVPVGHCCVTWSKSAAVWH